MSFPRSSFLPMQTLVSSGEAPAVDPRDMPGAATASARDVAADAIPPRLRAIPSARGRRGRDDPACGT
jgi:hypothetical protein